MPRESLEETHIRIEKQWAQDFHLLLISFLKLHLEVKLKLVGENALQCRAYF